jgi:hypothetical protein
LKLNSSHEDLLPGAPACAMNGAQPNESSGPETKIPPGRDFGKARHYAELRFLFANA